LVKKNNILAPSAATTKNLGVDRGPSAGGRTN